MLQAPNAKRFTFWAVLGAGIFAGAVAANGHATSPPGVNPPKTNAGIASVAPDADLHDRLTGSQTAAAEHTAHPQPVQKALSTPGEDALVFLDSPKAPATSTAGEPAVAAAPLAANGPRFAMLLILVFGLLGVGALVVHFLKKGRSATGERGPRLELVDSLRIAGKWHVSLVRAPGRLLVIGASEGEVSLLADLDEEMDVSHVLTDTLVDLPAAPAPVEASTPQSAAPTGPIAGASMDTDAQDDPFFASLLERMNARQPAFSPSASVASLDARPANTSSSHEMAAIRARIAAYEQRNAHIA